MKMAKTLPLKLQGYYNSTMLFEEEGQSSYSKKNKYATEIQKIELGFIKQLMTGKTIFFEFLNFYLCVYLNWSTYVTTHQPQAFSRKVLYFIQR